MTPQNTYVYPDGRKRQCRVCKSAATERYLASPKGKVAQHRAGRRYEYSTKGMVRQLRRDIKRVRQRIDPHLSFRPETRLPRLSSRPIPKMGAVT